MSDETVSAPRPAETGLRHRFRVAKWLFGLWLAAGVTFLSCSGVNTAVGTFRLSRRADEANRILQSQRAATATAFALQSGAPAPPTATPAGLLPWPLPSLPGFGAAATPAPATPVSSAATEPAVQPPPPPTAVPVAAAPPPAGDAAPAGDVAPAGDAAPAPTLEPAPTSSTSMFSQLTAEATASPTPEPTATAAAALVAAPIAREHIAASASDTAPPGQDACGVAVSYPPDNTTDGDAATAWRVLGDGVGARLRLTFDAPVTVTELRILIGYAKLDACAGGVDRWPQGYRASAVDLVFSDGTAETYQLADLRDVQALPLARPVTAQWVELTVRAARPPAADGAPRPYAAISEIVVVGGRP